MAKKSKLTAQQAAFSDISKSLKKNGAKPYNPFYNEIWTVTPNQLNCPEVRKLNKELKI